MGYACLARLPGVAREAAHAISATSRQPPISANPEDVLRGHPAVLVVISSSWRHSQSTEELRLLFSHDIRPRVFGVTPPAKVGIQHGRFSEIIAWLALNSRQGDHWIALDDYAFEFPRNCPKLLLCDGFEHWHLERNLNGLSKASASSSAATALQ